MKRLKTPKLDRKRPGTSFALVKLRVPDNPRILCDHNEGGITSGAEFDLMRQKIVDVYGKIKTGDTEDDQD